MLIVVTIAVLDPWHRYAIPRIAAAAIGSGLAANVLKLFLGRARPQHFDLNLGGLDSFTDWLPMLRNHSWDQSFPSSHTATAAGLAIVLACYYPRPLDVPGLRGASAGFERSSASSSTISATSSGAAPWAASSHPCASTAAAWPNSSTAWKNASSPAPPSSPASARPSSARAIATPQSRKCRARREWQCAAV